MISVAICDDEPIFLQYFYKLLFNEFNAIACSIQIEKFTDGKLFLSQHESNPFDVVFLDIDMPDFSGFDIAKTLQENHNNCNIVFVTNYGDLVYDSLYYQPFNFICKEPNSFFEKRLHLVVLQIVQNFKQNQMIGFENDSIGKTSVRLKDIVFVESNQHSSIFHTIDNNKIFVKRESINDVKISLEKYDFIHIHRKYIVNLRYFLKLDRTNNYMLLRNGVTLPISRKKKDYIENAYTEYLRRTI